MSLRDFLTALGGSRKSINGLQEKIDRLRDQIAELRARPPDAEAVLAWALRSVDRLAGEFEANLRDWYLKPEHIDRVPGEWFDDDRGPAWLEEQQHCPGQGQSQSKSTRRDGAGELDPRALMFFLAPAIRETLPEAIRKLYAVAPDAMPSAERRRKLDQLEAELAAAEADRDQLLKELADTRRQIDEVIQ